MGVAFTAGTYGTDPKTEDFSVSQELILAAMKSNE